MRRLVQGVGRMAASNSNAVRTYGNWRRPTSPGLFGLGSVGTGVMLGGLVFCILVTMARGLLWGLGVFLVLAVVLGLLAVKDHHGKSLLEKGLENIAWQRSRQLGAHLYRSGPLGLTAWGTHQLPGLAAQLRLSEHQDAHGRRFVLLYTPSTNTFATVIATEPDGAALVDQEQVDVWVAAWGHWLANLGDEPGVEAAAVIVETAPDTGHRLAREVTGQIDPEAPAFARAMLEQVVAAYPVGSSQVRAWVTLTFSGTSSSTGKRMKPAEMGRELAARLPGLTSMLSATGAGAARLLSAAEVCEIVRVAYDPAASVVVEDAKIAGEDTGLTWDEVGPVAHEALWDGYRHDSAYSVTWSMTTAPRGNVQSSVLARLLAPHPALARKRVAMLYRPIDAARAAGMVEADLRASQFVASSSKNPTARSGLSVRAAAATAQEEAAGAGLVNFSMLVTATITDPTREAEARAVVDNLAATARVRLRPVYGAQHSGFAATLPLGLVLPKHLKIPTAIQERL